MADKNPSGHGRRRVELTILFLRYIAGVRMRTVVRDFSSSNYFAVIGVPLLTWELHSVVIECLELPRQLNRND